MVSVSASRLREPTEHYPEIWRKRRGEVIAALHPCPVFPPVISSRATFQRRGVCVRETKFFVDMSRHIYFRRLRCVGVRDFGSEHQEKIRSHLE